MPQKDLENVLSCHPQMISKSPPGSLCGTSCLSGSVSTEGLCILSSAVQVVGCVFLAQEYRKKGDAKTLVLARRRATADKQASSTVLTAAFDSFHLASAVQAPRSSTSKGLFFRVGGTGEGRAKMTQMPRPEVSEQLLLRAVMLKPFLSPQRRAGVTEAHRKGLWAQLWPEQH